MRRCVIPVAALLMSTAASTSQAETLVVDFDSLNARGDALVADPLQEGDPVTEYLRGNGIEVVDQKPQTRKVFVVILATSATSETIAPSYPNVITQRGANGPISYTLRFKRPLASIAFTRAGLNAGPHGISHPGWSASALDAGGHKIGTVSEALIREFSTVEPRKFLLAAQSGQRIAAIEVNADNENFAAFNSPVLDDFILTFAPTH